MLTSILFLLITLSISIIIFAFVKYEKKNQLLQEEVKELKLKLERLDYYKANLVKNEIDTMQKQNEKLRESNLIDDMTHVYNKRGIKEKIEDLLKRGTAFSILMYDIDRFKLVNDSLGHVVGDSCIKILAKYSRLVCRRGTDFVGRYGGDEFLIILESTTLDYALEIGEKLRRLIEEKSDPKFTISIGVSYINSSQANITMEDVYKYVDKGLYKAKENGRNQIGEGKHLV